MYKPECTISLIVKGYVIQPENILKISPMLLYSYVYNNLFHINNTACAKIQLNAGECALFY